jgi:hypothetical protein
MFLNKCIDEFLKMTKIDVSTHGGRVPDIINEPVGAQFIAPKKKGRDKSTPLQI